MRVNLRRAKALVAKQFLDAAQIGPVVQQMRGKAMPQRVRADAGIEAGADEVFVEFAPDRSRAERFTVLVQEDADGIAALALGINSAQAQNTAAGP